MRLARQKIYRDIGSLVPHACTPSDRLSDMWGDKPAPDPIYGPVRICQRLDESDWEKAISSIVEAFQEICLHHQRHAEIASSCRERKSELQQLNDRFYFKDRELVCEFLKQHSFLIPTLFEARKQIDRFFGTDTLSNLELVTDPEDSHSVPKLFALILTNLSSLDASIRLDNIDNEWWLEQPREVRRVLSIDVDYLDGGL